MIIERYKSEKKEEWDSFVKESKNGTFLFLRDYMEYHADRFNDFSLIYYNDKGRLIALLPANAKENIIFSHQGLTYGGFILTPKTHISEINELFISTIEYLKNLGFTTWYYKQMPSIYHLFPAEEDSYSLWRLNASVEKCNMMTALPLQTDIKNISSRKKTYCNKLQRQGFSIEIDSPIEGFWPILEQNLMERFSSHPVHSLSEIRLLKKRFEKEIVCCTVKSPDGTILAGTLLYISSTVVRTQYISASHEGKHCNALDYLMLSLIDYYKNKGFKYFELGTSMAEDAVHLNEGLILQKEGFGGRSIACKEYKIEI